MWFSDTDMTAVFLSTTLNHNGMKTTFAPETFVFNSIADSVRSAALTAIAADTSDDSQLEEEGGEL